MALSVGRDTTTKTGGTTWPQPTMLVNVSVLLLDALSSSTTKPKKLRSSIRLFVGVGSATQLVIARHWPWFLLANELRGLYTCERLIPLILRLGHIT